MVYNNNENVKSLKTWLMITGLTCLIAMTAFILAEKFIIFGIIGGVFLLGAFIVIILNFQYIRFMVEKDKLIFRYYSVFAFNRNYQSIEIPIEHLRKVEVFKVFFGLKWDLRFTVRIRQGIAEYPLVSLSAVPLKDRRKVFEELKNLVPKKDLS
jgi:hypothetical protein